MKICRFSFFFRNFPLFFNHPAIFSTLSHCPIWMKLRTYIHFWMEMCRFSFFFSKFSPQISPLPVKFSPRKFSPYIYHFPIVRFGWNFIYTLILQPHFVGFHFFSKIPPLNFPPSCEIPPRKFSPYIWPLSHCLRICNYIANLTKYV